MFQAIRSTRQLLLRRPQLTAVSVALEVPYPRIDGLVTVYDLRQNSYYKRREFAAYPTNLRLLPLSPQHRCETVCFYTKDYWQQSTQVARNFADMLKCVNLQDMESAPSAAFWTTVAVGGGQLIIPVLEIIGGYSPVMTLLQLNTAAVTLGFMGGSKWGMAISEANPLSMPYWETLRKALLPPAMAVTGLLLPYPLGFLTIASGMVTSLYLDLKACEYPPWVIATRMFMTMTTVAGLLLAMVAYTLFHNRNKDKKQVDRIEENVNEIDIASAQKVENSGQVAKTDK